MFKCFLAGGGFGKRVCSFPAGFLKIIFFRDPYECWKIFPLMYGFARAKRDTFSQFCAEKMMILDHFPLKRNPIFTFLDIAKWKRILALRADVRQPRRIVVVLSRARDKRGQPAPGKWLSCPEDNHQEPPCPPLIFRTLLKSESARKCISELCFQ